MSHIRWAEIDAGALRHNVAVVRSLLSPATHLLAMVKSDGYGHGAVVAARAAVESGAQWLGVYTPDEALELRRAGFAQPILVAGWSPSSELSELVDAGVDVTVLDPAGVAALDAAAAASGRVASAHVKLDTGLGRLGVRPDALAAMESALRAARSVRIAGLYTHFADAANDSAFTDAQHRAFLDMVSALRGAAPEALLHTAGSAAIVASPSTHHDLVRAGILLYGYSPAAGVASPGLRPAMTVVAQVAQVKTVARGDSVGYGRTWHAPGRRRIATVAIGYGQGLRRDMSNNGEMLVRGRRCPLVGTVSMDQVTLDVSEVEGVEQGDEAVLFGSREGEHLGADEVAGRLGTISYEVLCAAGAALPRVAAPAPRGGG